MGKVTWGFTSSLDGFIAGPGHDMSWLSAAEELDEQTVQEMADAVGVIISGRDGYDAARAQADERDELTAEAYGGRWDGTEIILTHRPQEIADDPAIMPLDCHITEAVRRAREIAGDKDVQIISAQIARQALEHDLIDEMQVFVAPVMLGDGIRIYEVAGGRRVDWELVQILDRSPRSCGRVYRPRRA
ncbi:dihydrofolate reductase [Brachybacterium phenoliresistens]|uniref:Dihydrofolate reductase n=1 Tax=Brachybacterium phenoliresistens TaxID=396014 RepID=Z9JQ77_9MICO|nr:dihydrofolate reductase family protein [Brachybacterium phenoliresistens]EWS80178.1 dihydrofolate reductase [Brachybacterium phenoliresistens]